MAPLPWRAASRLAQVSSPGSPGFCGVEYRIHCTRAGARIERLQERRRVEVVAGADEDVIADDHRRVRREVLLVERRDLVPPDFLAGLRVEADDPVVVQLEVDVVVPHAERRASAGWCRRASSSSSARAPRRRARRWRRRCRATTRR